MNDVGCCKQQHLQILTERDGAWEFYVDVQPELNANTTYFGGQCPNFYVANYQVDPFPLTSWPNITARKPHVDAELLGCQRIAFEEWIGPPAQMICCRETQDYSYLMCVDKHIAAAEPAVLAALDEPHPGHGESVMTPCVSKLAPPLAQQHLRWVNLIEGPHLSALVVEEYCLENIALLLVATCQLRLIRPVPIPLILRC